MDQNTFYYIDPTVLGYLLNLVNNEDIEEAYLTYLAEYTKVVNAAVEGYLSESSMDEGKKQAIKNSLDQKLNDPNLSSQANQPPDYLLMKELDDPQLQERIKKTVNILNKALYLQYQGSLIPDRKNKLNEYLRETESRLKTDVQNTIKLVQIIEEYEKLKTQQPNQEVGQSQQTSSAMKEYQEFLKMQHGGTKPAEPSTTIPQPTQVEPNQPSIVTEQPVSQPQPTTQQPQPSQPPVNLTQS